ncbi:MAG: L-histidine N(alpha)-methyltransferase [Deltaproteobacteria bacterium]|nr:L-histidine N(alpha)-methyltransferase [Deltaproteobacteria bacterium]
MTLASRAAPVSSDPLARLDRHLATAHHREQLATDVRRGLTAPRKWLPPKYFYDDEGSRLFEAICELPEYYLTRTEDALLARIAGEVIAAAAPTQLVELGSGASRKTRQLLDALVATQPDPWYVPVDVNETMLRQSIAALRADYPTVGVHALVADFEQGLPPLPPAARRLVAFLGSSIGNFVPPADVRLLAALAARSQPGDGLLLGADLVKAPARLEAAYDDAAGVTAAFNRNVLRVINRELDADFAPDRFTHVARYDAERAQIEMYLRADGAQRVRIAALDLTVEFAAGETIHTETSRKFTRASLETMLAASGWRLTDWYASPDDAFALLLARVEGTA